MFKVLFFLPFAFAYRSVVWESTHWGLGSDESTGCTGWCARRKAELEQESLVLNTSKGVVEYVMRGSPPYILELHSTPGGFDQDWGKLFNTNPFKEFGSIRVSRPGYLRTPLETGRTVEEAADAYAALLDELGAGKVVVHGWDGGGPHAIQFAARHPQRCYGLMLTSALSKRSLEYSFWSNWYMTWGAKLATTSPMLDILTKELKHAFPYAFIRQTLRDLSTWDEEELEKQTRRVFVSKLLLDKLQQHFVSEQPIQLKSDGLANDMDIYTQSGFELPCSRVTSPTLIVHGSADGEISFDHAEHAKNAIPRAELHVVENGSHLLWIAETERLEAMIRAQLDFLRRVMATHVTHTAPPTPERQQQSRLSLGRGLTTQERETASSIVVQPRLSVHRQHVRQAYMHAAEAETKLSRKKLYVESNNQSELHKLANHTTDIKLVGGKSYGDGIAPTNNFTEEFEEELQPGSGTLDGMMPTITQQCGCPIFFFMSLLFVLLLIACSRVMWQRKMQREEALETLRRAAHDTAKLALLANKPTDWHHIVIHLRELRKNEVHENHLMYSTTEAHMDEPGVQSQLQALFYELSEGQQLLPVGSLKLMLSNLHQDIFLPGLGRPIAVPTEGHVWLPNDIVHPVTFPMFASIFALSLLLHVHKVIILHGAGSRDDAQKLKIEYSVKILSRVALRGTIRYGTG